MRDDVPRHKTAMTRTDVSRPVRMALTDGLLNEESTFFDFGCGRGGDVMRLNAMGVAAYGWDPTHQPNATQHPAAVVNLGYVINVIEDPVERCATLGKAWALAETLLIVSARLSSEARALGTTHEFADGCMTSLGTFQKFYDQQELKAWIEQVLETIAVPAGPGVFYLFRDEQARAVFEASRYRRRILAPRRSRSVELFNQHEALLDPLIVFVTDRGRIPANDELSEFAAIVEEFGSVKRAFHVVRLATSSDQWDAIAVERAEELLIYLALSRFDGRPIFSKLPRPLQLDVKSFFSRYNKACQQADELLFSIGDTELLNAACTNASFGKLLPGAFYVHVDALDRLPSILRLFEGCARGLIGRMEGATLVKLSRGEPIVSYLSYPEFETDPHPSLSLSVTVNLQTFRASYRNYQTHKNPPILHRKECFLTQDHALFAKFARLTRIEESKGLYEETSRIGTRDGWAAILATRGLTYKGHRLIRQSPKQSERPDHQ